MSVVLTNRTGRVSAVALSPDGKTLAIGSTYYTVTLQDVATGRTLHVLPGTDTVNVVAFSPDGKILATGSTDNAVRLWDVATGQLLTTLAGPTDTVNAVAFSPDGKVLASGSDDGTVWLWDAATGQSITTLSGHTGPVSAVAFSPDARPWPPSAGITRSATSYTVRLWDTAYASNPAAFLCAAWQTLTGAEWTQLIPSGIQYQSMCP
jgi:WD40 repeat protein